MSVLERLSHSKNLQFWIFQFTFWMSWASFHFMFSFNTWIILADAIFAAMLTAGLRYFYQSVRERALWEQTVFVIMASSVVGLLWNVFKRQMERMYYGEDIEAVIGEIGAFGYYTSQYFGLSAWIIILWSGLYVGLNLYHLLQEERATSLSARAMAQEAQLRMLRYQLNPHFLFNTLNAISTLIMMEDNDHAKAMLQKLSRFLRYSLDKGSVQKVDLAQEIATLELYLDIEKVRFEERLKVEFDVTEEAARGEIPSMLLQPLVENAIKYAVAANEAGGTIKISASVFADQMLLSVQDDGPGIELVDGNLPSSGGIGIKNTRDRLREVYGKNQSLLVKNFEPRGLSIEISLPYEPVGQPVPATAELAKA